MISHVFTVDAITTCERRGHAWKRQEPWKGSGVTHDECWRCGASTAGYRLPLPAEAIAEPAVTASHMATASAHAPGRSLIDTPPNRLRGGGRKRTAEAMARDAEIVRLVGSGTPPIKVAEIIGVTRDRIYQILGRARRAAAVAGGATEEARD